MSGQGEGTADAVKGSAVQGANAGGTGIERTRFVLRPVNNGYKIECLTWDDDLQGWFHAQWLNSGRKFPSEEAARDFMLTLERDAFG